MLLSKPQIQRQTGDVLNATNHTESQTKRTERTYRQEPADNDENVKVSVAVKLLDNQTEATQISHFELVLHKDSNGKIVE